GGRCSGAHPLCSVEPGWGCRHHTAGNWEGKPLLGGVSGTGLSSQLGIPGKSSGISQPRHSWWERGHAWASRRVPGVRSRPHPPSRLPQQTCAVCLEDFKAKEELGVLPCQHAFHRKCLVKWLEVRCVCPMCNKPMAGPAQPRAGIGTLLDELV
uniref:Ring finger protein 122 n=1 Tax=Calidris pygmaea TaxID=425635 RepID=A0A8C3JKR2_9CHAR